MSRSSEKKCPECCSSDTFHFDPFGYGDLLDEHVDISISETELNTTIQDALDMAKRLGGQLPSGLEGELADLIKPKLTWQDFVRFIKVQRKIGNSRNNWNSPNRKLIFGGLYVPKKIDYKIKILLAYDCSGSMSKEDISYGVSQVQALAQHAEGWCLPWDSEPYFDSAVKINNANASSLKNAKYKGGGGTSLCPVLEKYEENIGLVDIIIIVSDFHLSDLEHLNKMPKPHNCDIIWLSVGSSNANFKPPFGRLFNLEN